MTSHVSCREPIGGWAGLWRNQMQQGKAAPVEQWSPQRSMMLADGCEQLQHHAPDQPTPSSSQVNGRLRYYR
jgi:hypothetical protein